MKVSVARFEKSAKKTLLSTLKTVKRAEKAYVSFVSKSYKKSSRLFAKLAKRSAKKLAPLSRRLESEFAWLSLHARPAQALSWLTIASLLSLSFVGASVAPQTAFAVAGGGGSTEEVFQISANPTQNGGDISVSGTALILANGANNENNIGIAVIWNEEGLTVDQIKDNKNSCSTSSFDPVSLTSSNLTTNSDNSVSIVWGPITHTYQSPGTYTAYAVLYHGNCTGADGFIDAQIDEFTIVVPPATTYSVTYDGNGNDSGTVPTDSGLYSSGDTVTVLDNTDLAKSGYSFNGWNTSVDGSGDSYVGGGTFSMPESNVTLFAQWTALPTFTVTYDGNGSDGGTVPTDSNNYPSGSTVTALGNTGSLTKSGNTFVGWNTAADGSGDALSGGEAFSMPGNDVTLFAQWTALPTFTVTYDGNGSTGGSVPTDSNSYLAGATVTVLGNTGSLVKAGNAFVGWNTAADGSGTAYVGGDTFSMSGISVTLFAQWTTVTVQDTTPPVSAFDDSHNHEIVSTETSSINLPGTSTDDMSGVASAELTLYSIPDVLVNGELNGESWETLNCSAMPESATVVDSASLALTNNPDSLNVTWSYGLTPSNTVYCAKVSATDVAGNVEHTAIAGPIAYTFTTPTPPPSNGGGGGGGGGGGSSGSCAAGFTFNPQTLSCDPSGEVLGASTGPEGEVLGESCSPTLTQYLKRGDAHNKPEQVSALQQFLIDHGFASFPAPTGYFGAQTEAAVEAFQKAHEGDVLTPWNLGAPTGLVYLTTRRTINLMACADLTITMPELVPWNLNPFVYNS